jgi:outer membrane receptor protein involved in Fe transport
MQKLQQTPTAARRRFKSGLRSALLTLSLIALLTGNGFGQGETGQITGVVTDPSGAVVPGATIIVRSDRTGTTRTVTTDSEGSFQFTNLQPGPYQLTASGQNFQEVKRTIEVTVGGRTTENIQLGVAATEARVEIVAGASVSEINTADQQVSEVVPGRLVQDLPTINRDPYQLIATVGNVSEGDPSTAGPAPRGAGGFNINGQRAASTSILLDGGENVDNYTASVGQSVPLDAVQEFRVQTSNFTAEYGRASGGIVNVVTKSGTNDFRGSLYAYNRNSKFASNTFENNSRGLPRDQFNRNQFGYSIGGPIVKNKLFFFNNTEWTRLRSVGPRTVYVPTPELIAASNANTRNFFNSFGQLRSNAQLGGVLTVGQLVQSLGLGTGAFRSLPAALPAFREVTYNYSQDVGAGIPQNSYQTVIRADYNISNRTQFYARYAAEVISQLEGTNADSPYQGYDTGLQELNNNFLASLTHQFTSNFIAQTRFTLSRPRDLQPLGERAAGPTLYFFANTAATIGGLNVALPGYLPFNPGSAIPAGGPESSYQFSQDFTAIRGNHTLKFGGLYVRVMNDRTFGAYQNAVETLGNSTEQALNNFVLGQLLQFQGAINPQGRFPGQTVTLPVEPPNFSRQNRYDEFAVYGQDSWRVRPGLTLNLGLRYEYYGPQRNSDPSLDSNFYFGSGSNIFEQIRNGRVQLAPDSSIGELYQKDNNNFAPRVGFAWDVFGDGRTSLRGGYGIAYERNFGNVTFNVIQNPPNYAVLSIFAADVGGTLPITTSNSGPLSGGSGSIVLPRTSLRHVREDIVNAYAHFYSLSFEREIFRDSTFSIDFSGSAGRKLYSIENINRAGTGLRYLGSTNAGSCPPGLNPNNRLNCQYSNINTRANNGYSNYNGVTFAFESNNLRNLGLTLTTRYTLSKAKDNLSTTFSESGNNFNLGLLDPFDPSLDYGPADFDVRHRLTSSFVWDLPFARNASGAARHLLGGWTLSGRFVARTGLPFTVFDCTPTAITVCLRLIPTGPVNFGKPDQLQDSGDPNSFIYTDLSNQTRSTFTDVSGGNEVGPFPADMTRRNAFRGPGFWNADLALFKNVRFTERMRLQLRAEAFNVFNHSNLYIVGSSADRGNGFVQAKKGYPASNVPAERRNIQLAVRFMF